MRIVKFALFSTLALVTMSAFASGVPEDELQENGRGIITNYSNMHEGDDIGWFWIAPGTDLSEHGCTFGSFKNLTTETDRDMREVFEEDLPEALKRACSGSAGALTVNGAIYWTEHANRAKAWIPFAGGHLAQAGVGIELVFTDASGKVVAKIRHSAREGDELEDAAEEVMDDVTEFVEEH